MDSNCGPLVSEATALPTEPQPLPKGVLIFYHKIHVYSNYIYHFINTCIISWTSKFQVYLGVPVIQIY